MPTADSSTAERAPKQLRAMLARGAACDLCRSRKVKCDGAKPVCAQCVKSARGNTADINCVYEGPSRAAKKRTPTSSVSIKDTPVAPVRKRSRDPSDDEEQENQEDAPFLDKNARKKRAARVDALVERIAELERRLEQQPSPTVPATEKPVPQYPAPPVQKFSWSPIPQYTTQAPPRKSYSNVVSWIPEPTRFIGNESFERSTSGSPSYSVSTPICLNQSKMLPDVTLNYAGFSLPKRPRSFSTVKTTLLEASQNSSASNSPETHGTTPPCSVDVPNCDTTNILAPELAQLLNPSWPMDLPSQPVLVNLIKVFFSRPNPYSSIFNPHRILSNLFHSPTSENFPSVAVLHSICAIAGIWMSPNSFDPPFLGTRPYWISERSPQDFHFKKALELIEDVSMIGEMALAQFNTLQAVIICCYVAFQRSTYPKLWTLIGKAVQMCNTLGLASMPAWDFARQQCRQWTPGNGVMMSVYGVDVTCHPLIAPETLEDHYERCATFWAVVALDRHAISFGVNLTSSFDDRDITTPLPTLIPLDPFAIYPQSEKFFKPTEQKLNSLQLYHKTMFLLGKILRIRSKLFHGVASNDEWDYADARKELSASEEFKQKDQDLCRLRSMLSSDFFQHENQVDVHMVAAFAVCHATSILLHEPMCERWDQSATSSFARCVNSAQCIINVACLLLATSPDFASTYACLMWCWIAAGRIFVKDFAVKRIWGKIDEARRSYNQAETCLMVIKECTMLNDELPTLFDVVAYFTNLMENPDALLPWEPKETKEIMETI